MISFKQIYRKDIEWAKIEGSDGANIFQTQNWFSFLEKSQGLSPTVVEINDGFETIGYFLGAISNKIGFKILGSPFQGWSTDFMGFALRKGVSCTEVLQELPKFVFNELGCHLLVITDPRIRSKDIQNLPYQLISQYRFVFDLTKSEDELFSEMDHDRRSNIRKAAKSGVVLEEAHDTEFAEEYHSQMTDVFARQSLKIPFTLKRVEQLIEEFLPTQEILLLRARNAEGVCIATYIDLAFNKVAVGWGGASRKEYQNLRPNEACCWYCIKYWKSRGMNEYSIGGGWRNYKSTYGCDEVQLLRLVAAKNPIINHVALRLHSIKGAKKMNWLARHLLN